MIMRMQVGARSLEPIDRRFLHYCLTSTQLLLPPLSPRTPTQGADLLVTKQSKPHSPESDFFERHDLLKLLERLWPYRLCEVSYIDHHLYQFDQCIMNGRSLRLLLVPK